MTDSLTDADGPGDPYGGIYDAAADAQPEGTDAADTANETISGIVEEAEDTLAGLEDDAIVENADEILAQFFGD